MPTNVCDQVRDIHRLKNSLFEQLTTVPFPIWIYGFIWKARAGVDITEIREIYFAIVIAVMLTLTMQGIERVSSLSAQSLVYLSAFGVF